MGFRSKCQIKGLDILTPLRETHLKLWVPRVRVKCRTTRTSTFLQLKYGIAAKPIVDRKNSTTLKGLDLTDSRSNLKSVNWVV